MKGLFSPVMGSILQAFATLVIGMLLVEKSGDGEEKQRLVIEFLGKMADVLELPESLEQLLKNEKQLGIIIEFAVKVFEWKKIFTKGPTLAVSPTPSG